MTATHPTDRELGEFLLGKLDDPAGSVESHLAECDSCRERAVAVQADDTFTELLAAARTRFDSRRASAPTPTLDGAATPPAFAPTLAWEGSTAADGTIGPPGALAGHPKYRPIRRLGTGGMGTVWLAEHQVMHRPVAVKVIRPDLLARPGATGRFLREVRAAAKLHHPNIVTAFDAEPAGDSCLLVMEYVPGETLGERLESGPLPLVEALRAVRDAARGLAHAHAHGLVHRDVKPHNLIRSADGSTKVLDFGLAGVGAGEAIAANGEGLTGAGMVVGTPDYIAPEQIADPHAADARADVYGLGCTLYHLLAGRSPMPDGSVMEKLAAQRTRPMDPIPGLPAAVAAVLAKMTAKDPAQRYQSADEVVAALEKCIRMVNLEGRCHRWRMNVFAGLLVTGLLVTAGVVFKIQRDNQEITVATNDDDIEVVMKRKGDVLRVVDKKTGQAWEIDTAKNEIAQADTPDGLAVKLPDSEPFVLRRNGKDVFTVTRTTTPAVAKPEVSLPGTPRLVRTIDHRHPVRGIAWTPDGQSVVAVGGGLCRYDVVKGRSGFQYRYEILSRLPGLKGNLDTEGPTQMVVSDDAQTAVIVYGSTLGRFSLADGKALGFQQLPEQDGKPPVVTALAVSPDGRTAVYAAGKELQFVDLHGPKADPPKSMHLVDFGAIVGLCYSPGGFLVAAVAHPAGNRTPLIVLDAQTHQVITRHEFTGMLGRLDVARDGKRLVAAGGVESKGAFTVLTLPDLDVVQQEAEVAGFVEAARLSTDGQRLTLERAPGAVEVWDVNRKVRVSDRPLPADAGSKAGDAPVRHVALAPDGRSVAVARGTEIGVWEVPATTKAESHEPAALVHDITWPKGEANVFYATFSPDGKYVLAGTDVWASITEVWETASGKHVATLPFPAGATFLPDGKTVLGVTKDQELALWDVTTNKEVRKFPARPTQGWVSVSADGTRAASYFCDDNQAGIVTVWSVPEGKPIAEITPARHEGAYIARITPDGQRVVTVGRRDNRVCLWDVADKRLLFEWHSAEGSLYGPVTFLPDGKSFITTSDTQTRGRVARFDQSAHEPTFPWDDKTQGAMGASPDGRIALIYNGNRTVRAFDLVAGKDLGSIDLPTKLHGYMAVSPDGRYGAATATSWQIHAPARVYVFRLPGAGGPPAATADRDLILGSWRGVAAEVNGQPMPRELIELMKPTLTFTADKMVGKPQGTVPKPLLDFAVARGMLPKETAAVIETGAEGIYHLDPAKAPREIDFTILGAIKKTALGIYQLDGDTLKLCLSIDPARVSERPKDFAAKAGEMRVVLTLRRLTQEEVILEDVERRIDPAKTDGKSLPFALLEHHGVAALRFGKWLLVFEGVPCDAGGKVLFGVGSFFLPNTGGRGNFADPGLKAPALGLRQQSTGRANEIGLKNYRFELEAKGARLVFADKTYEATDQVQTIVIARDGTTRVEGTK